MSGPLGFVGSLWQLDPPLCYGNLGDHHLDKAVSRLLLGEKVLDVLGLVGGPGPVREGVCQLVASVMFLLSQCCRLLFAAVALDLGDATDFGEVNLSGETGHLVLIGSPLFQGFSQ